MFAKENRLKKRKQFNYIHQNGNATSNDLMTLKSVYTKSTCYKVGFSVSKKIGNAVIRNKIKRQMKEAFRKLNFEIPKTYYFIILAKKPIIDATFNDICICMDMLVRNSLKNHKDTTTK